jgi:uncharacterized membrane protein
LCGRVFWLLFDHLFLEKIVLGTAIAGSGICLRLFRRLHTSTVIGSLMVVFVLIMLLWYSYLSGGHTNG